MKTKFVRISKKSNKGITLIALVITIIILIILAGVSINLIIGKNGLITTATRAKKEMAIAEGKEKIEMALLDMSMERNGQGESCTLDYISENWQVKDVQIEGIKGKPVVKIYLSYQDYMYKIASDLIVSYIGDVNIKEEPELEIIRDTTQTGVEEVNLTVKAKVEEGEISEIVKPDGSVEYSSEVYYKVTENGDYTFEAITEKGMKEEKTVKIESIAIKDAIEIGTSSGEGQEGEGQVVCEHVYEKKYDENNHWDQCIFCGNKKDTISHTIITTGEDSCSSRYPAQIKYCTDGCGYKVTLPKKQHSNLSWSCAAGNYTHRYECGVCSANTREERCRDAQGNELGCKTERTGTCAVCKHIYTNANHAVTRYGKCGACGKKFYDVSSTYEIVDEMTTEYKWHISNQIEGISEIKDLNSNGAMMQVPAIGTTIVKSEFNYNDDGSIDVVKVLKTNKNSQTVESHIALQLQYLYNNTQMTAVEYCDAHLLQADNKAPEAQSITVQGASGTEEFARSATITATFEETWDNIVEMALFDSDGSVISNWSTAERNGTTFTKTFNVVAETTTSKELTVKAKDRCGNIGEGKVTIGKIDTKAPTLVSPTSYNADWTISKEIKVEATEEGAGNVQIALGDESDYQGASQEENKYYRSYRFTGDVYEDIIRYVYIKDGVGNVASHRITIGKLDRTSPTISNINTNSNTITIEANDINTKLSKEGSGIKGYALSKSKEVPADNGFQTSNSFTVEEAGTYYIWVKDNAGNLSETKELQIKF